MAHLVPIPFGELALRMRREAQACGSIFDLPARKWWTPDPAFDFSAPHFGRRASTPVGPAAGPHTQLAQNIVLAWLAGGRIIELKTVQVNDRLRIPRPCIHVPNVGYNVEWSQELRVEESLREYAKAAFLIEILRATRAFGRFPSEHGLDTVFDISVGYDLEGIRGDKVTGFLLGLRHPEALYEELRGELRGELEAFRGLEPPSPIASCVTLSTFHGCPAGQIESIARYLLEEMGLDVIIKLNPTLLGFEAVRELLHERLGYTHLDLGREAFDVDLQYEDGLRILRRLRPVAEARGTSVGAKFTNTLVVRNDDAVFPTQSEPWMYLSGPPLHVISMNLMQRFRTDLGFELPVSFSAGIDVKNVAAAVSCGMVPVTSCTDLLKQGGFGRLSGYLRALRRDMEKTGVRSREAYVLAAHEHGAEAIRETFGGGVAGPGLGVRRIDELSRLAAGRPDDLPAAIRAAADDAGLDPQTALESATRTAGRLNGEDIVPRLKDDRRYHATANSKPPRRIESVLELYDCINCDLCIAACPNDAIFAYAAEPRTVATHRMRVEGERVSLEAGMGFSVREEHQLAVYAGACNECSNCEVYCPEEGAPYRVKERLFPSEEIYRASPDDGFWRAEDALLARLDGRELRLEVDEPANGAVVSGDGLHLDLRWDTLEVVGASAAGDATASLDGALVWRMRTAWESIYRSEGPNPVNPGGRS